MKNMELARIALRKAMLEAKFPGPTASDIANGKRRPTLDQANEIHRVTGIPVSAWVKDYVPLKEMWEQIKLRAN